MAHAGPWDFGRGEGGSLKLGEQERNYLRGWRLSRQSIGDGPRMSEQDVASWAGLLLRIPIRDNETQALLDGLLSTGCRMELAVEQQQEVTPPPPAG